MIFHLNEEEVKRKKYVIRMEETRLPEMLFKYEPMDKRKMTEPT